MMQFCKYQGAGNDFVLIDNRTGVFNATKEAVSRICNRRFGVGADGLMLLENDKDTDFYMRYFNADGNEGTMCGNGGRCMVAFARKLGIVDGTTRFNSSDGLHLAIIIDYQEPSAIVNLNMCDVDSVMETEGYYFLNTGSPHYVQVVDRIEGFDVVGEGRRIRHSEFFAPRGTNVNFVEQRDNRLLIATFERGVEDETLACGTGATAAAIALNMHKPQGKYCVELSAKGGDLKVCFDKTAEGTYRNIWLEGPATFVFAGTYDMSKAICDVVI